MAGDEVSSDVKTWHIYSSHIAKHTQKRNINSDLCFYKDVKTANIRHVPQSLLRRKRRSCTNKQRTFFSISLIFLTFPVAAGNAIGFCSHHGCGSARVYRPIRLTTRRNKEIKFPLPARFLKENRRWVTSRQASQWVGGIVGLVTVRRAHPPFRRFLKDCGENYHGNSRLSLIPWYCSYNIKCY